jgi:hypothetical protein
VTLLYSAETEEGEVGSNRQRCHTGNMFHNIAASAQGEGQQSLAQFPRRAPLMKRKKTKKSCCEEIFAPLFLKVFFFETSFWKTAFN